MTNKIANKSYICHIYITVYIKEIAELNTALFINIICMIDFCYFNFTRNYFIALKLRSKLKSTYLLFYLLGLPMAIYGIYHNSTSKAWYMCACVHVYYRQNASGDTLQSFCSDKQSAVATPLTLNLRERKRGVQAPHS